MLKTIIIFTLGSLFGFVLAAVCDDAQENDELADDEEYY